MQAANRPTPEAQDGDPEGLGGGDDQIVAEIKMSLSMSSITSGGEASPEREPRGPEPGPGDSPRPAHWLSGQPGPQQTRGQALSR